VKIALIVFFSYLLGVGGLYLFLVFVGVNSGASFWIILFGLVGFLYVLKKMADKGLFKNQ
jgi:inner membrane protein involved in colicin E2 resistance